MVEIEDDITIIELLLERGATRSPEAGFWDLDTHQLALTHRHPRVRELLGFDEQVGKP